MFKTVNFIITSFDGIFIGNYLWLSPQSVKKKRRKWWDRRFQSEIFVRALFKFNILSQNGMMCAVINNTIKILWRLFSFRSSLVHIDDREKEWGIVFSSGKPKCCNAWIHKCCKIITQEDLIKCDYKHFCPLLKMQHFCTVSISISRFVI